MITQYSNKNEIEKIDFLSNIKNNNINKQEKISISHKSKSNNSDESLNESIIDSITNYVNYKNTNHPKIKKVDKNKFNLFKR